MCPVPWLSRLSNILLECPPARNDKASHAGQWRAGLASMGACSQAAPPEPADAWRDVCRGERAALGIALSMMRAQVLGTSSKGEFRAASTCGDGHSHERSWLDHLTLRLALRPAHTSEKSTGAPSFEPWSLGSASYHAHPHSASTAGFGLERKPVPSHSAAPQPAPAPLQILKLAD